MTDPAGRTAHGSTAHRGTGWQPPAEQPTEVVPLDRYEVTGEVPHEGDTDDGDDGYDGGWAPEYSTAPVAVRRGDVLAGLLLLLAGMAAGVSLLVVWVNGGPTGQELVAEGLDDARGGAAALADTGAWPPLAVVGGGAVLFLLGLLMYAPARAHRFLGALALLVALVVAAGVLVPLADLDWDLTRWAVGAWFTAAVGGLGLLGALKALGTGPRSPR
jgi:hypothetical protein